MPSEPRLLSTDEVAHRLGVKPATVYAYVSRGLLSSRRNADGKGSMFTRDEVDAFVAGRKQTGTPTIQTGITLIKDGNVYYRGRDVCILARTATFESVVSLLWTNDLEHVALVPQDPIRTIAASASATLPGDARLADRLRVIVAAAATADPLRFDTTPAAVVSTGRTLLATMVAALPVRRLDSPDRRAGHSGDATLATTFWNRLTMVTPTRRDAAQLDAALVLLADHDLAASTLAARVAASTRAHPYAVVSAGLAALDGPLHGAASGLAHGLLAEAVARKDPVATIAARLRSGAAVPGFGHHLYPAGDPRATALLDLLDDGPVLDCARRLAEAMHARAGTHPNVDLALAAFALQKDLPPDAGEAIFAVARTVGWLAHALEEYQDRPSRFRPRGVYAGPTP